MKASICPKYGSPDVLIIQEVDKPTPKDNEVLIKVHATTANRTDLAYIRGIPKFARLFYGLTKPKFKITGSDFAGQVESTGKNVTTFKPGDRVMGFAGMSAQSHAEYMTFPHNKAIIKIPEGITYDIAVATMEGAFYAHSSINYLKPKSGQTALLHGATGAIGSAMLQLLKHYGLHVTATCYTENVELVRSLGADRIIDNRKEDFLKDNNTYDFVLDAVGKSTFAKCKPLLNKKGIYTSTDGLINFLLTLTTSFSSKKVILKPPTNIKAGIIFLIDLVEKRKFWPVIDRKYPLDKIVEAFTYVATGQKIGNVIITMDAQV